MKKSTSLLAFLTVAASATLQAGILTWDGGGVSGTDLGTAANWSTDVLPDVSIPDTMQWDGTVSGPLSLVYSNAVFAGASGNAGANLNILGTQTDSLNIDSGANTGAIRLNNITIASGAGAFSLGNGANVFNLTLGGAAGTHTWTNNSTAAATVASEVSWGLGGGGSHTLVFTGSGNWNLNNVVGQGSGTLTLNKSGTGALTLSGLNTYTGGLVMDAGTLNINHAAAIGNTTGGVLTINGGTIDNTSGAAITTTTAKALSLNGDFTFTGGSGTTHDLSFNGGVATVGGTSGANRQVTVSAGNLTIGSIAGQISSVGGTGYGLVKAGAGTLTITGGGNVTGSLNISGGTINSAGDLKVGSLSGSGTIGNGGGSDKWFFVGNGTNSTFSGVIQNTGAGRLGLNKSGIGTLTLTGTNTYSAQTTLNGGTIEYGSSSLPGVTQSLSGGAGGLVFNAGDGAIKSTFGSSGTTSLTFGTALPARVAGATGNFIINGGVNGSTNSIFLTKAAGFIDKGIYFNGDSYAWMDGTNTFVRGINYTTDGVTVATSGTTGSLASIAHQEFTGDITGQATATFTTLKDNGNNNFTLASGQTVTVGGILKSGNVAGGATISGGTGITTAASAELVIRTDGANDALTISTPILNATSTSLTKSGAGTLTLSGPNTYTGTTNVDGGTLILSGNSGSATGALIVNAGTLAVSGTLGAGNAITVGVRGATNSRLNIQSGASISKVTLSVGGNADSVGAAVGAVYQSGGSLTLTQAAGGSNMTLGNSANGYGYYSLSGGTLTTNEIGIGAVTVAGSVGVMDVSGGNFIDNGYITIGRGANASSGILNVTGGSVTAVRAEINWAGTAGATSIINVGGGAGAASIATTASTTLGVNLASANIAGTVGMLNLLPNGTLTTGIVTAGNANPTALVNFNGGTLKATATNASTGFMTSANIDAVNVFSGGGTIDNSGTAITVSKALLAPAANGVTNIAVSDGGSGYVGAPMVTVTGGTGSGASAYAKMVDDGTGNGTFKIDSIVVTSPGSYTVDPTTVNVVGGGASTVATIGSVTAAANTSGSMTFSGTSAGVTTLTGASTFSGNVSISGGTKVIANLGNNVLNPTNSALGNNQVSRNITLSGSSTLQFNSGDTMGSATSTIASKLVIGSGSTVTNGGGVFNRLGSVDLNGGTLTATSGAVTGYQAYSFDSSAVVTVGGSTVSTISSAGANGGIHLNTNTSFVVADATGSAASDLNVSAPLINRNQTEGGAGGLSKSGAGTMTLTGVNTYTGATTISNGTLALGVGGSIANTSTIDVQSGATLDASALSGWSLATGQTLKGNGTVDVGGANTFTVGGGASLAPGASPGTLAVTGTLSFAALSTFSAEIAPSTPTSDLVNVSGDLNIDATASLALSLFGTDTALAEGTKFTLIDYSGAWNNVAFAGFADDTSTVLGMNTYMVDYNDPTLGGTALTLTVIPEPTTATLIGGLGMLGLLRRRRNNG